MRHFKTARMDLMTKMLTVFLISICIAVPVTTFFLAKKDTEIPFAAVWFTSIVLMGAVVVSYLLSPKISIERRTLIISNQLIKKRIPIESIKGVKKYDRIGLNIRTFGIAGLFGYFGYFNGGDIWYVTNIRKKVKIQTYGKLYVISPENPEEFMQAINDLRLNNSATF